MLYKTIKYFTVYLLFLSVIACSPKSVGHRGSTYSAARKKSTNAHTKKYTTTTTANRTGTKSEKAETSTSSIRIEIVQNAKKYTGLPYKYGGRSPESGFDCSGFTSYVFNQTGIPISGPSHQQAQLGKHVKKTDLEPGDLVFFGDQNRISHVGIVASHHDQNIEIVHSTTSAGVKTDNISTSDYWSSKFLFGIDVISSKKHD